jgi:hypothetical protein
MSLHSTKSLENIDLSDCSPSDTTIEDKMEGVRGTLIELPHLRDVTFIHTMRKPNQLK